MAVARYVSVVNVNSEVESVNCAIFRCADVHSDHEVVSNELIPRSVVLGE